jgi:2,4-diaminopentanoate dehydrogenase
MADSRTRIALCGLGSIGRAAARILLDHRSGFEIVGAVTKQDDAIGRPLHEVAGAATAVDVTVGSELDGVLELRPDLVIYCTGSFLSVVREDVDRIVDVGASMVSPCEELAFPFTRDPDYAAALHERARRSGVTVLGTGVNPGFIFDALLLAGTGSAWDVRSIRGRRVVDVSGFAQNIHLRLGIGYTAEQFEQGHADGSIAGHVGFRESIQIVAERLGVTLDGPVRETFVPMLATELVDTPYGGVPAGSTEGFIQRATGTVGGKPFMELELLLHLRPRQAGYETSDTFSIDGAHPVNLTLSPGMDAIPATSAQLVNAIPAVLAAEPGLKTIKDIPAAAAWTDLERRLFR